MSIAIHAGKFTRGDVFFVDPNELTVAFDDNVRRFPVSDDRIRELAHDIAGSPHGQIQPVTVRRIQDNRLKLVAGYNRYRAILACRRGVVARDGDAGFYRVARGDAQAGQDYRVVPDYTLLGQRHDV